MNKNSKSREERKTTVFLEVSETVSEWMERIEYILFKPLELKNELGNIPYSVENRRSERWRRKIIESIT